MQNELISAVAGWFTVATERAASGEDVAPAGQAHLHDVLDSIPAFIGLATPSGAPQFFNRFALDYLGATPDDVSGWKAAETVHPDDLPIALSAWQRTVETGEPYDCMQRVRRGDGSYRWFRARGLPLRDAEGRIARWFIVDADVDEQKRSEDLLAGEKQLLEMVARDASAQDIVEAFCRLVERTIEGCRCTVRLLDGTQADVRQVAVPGMTAGPPARTAAGGDGAAASPCAEALRTQHSVIVADIATDASWASSAWAAHAMSLGLRSCWATPIMATSGDALGVFTVEHARPTSPERQDHVLVSQLTHMASVAIERMHSQQALKQALDDVRASEDRLRNLIDAVPGFVWSTWPDGRVDFLNQRWSDYTGMPTDEARGFGWTHAVHPDDAEGLATYWHGLLAAGRAGEYEARLRRHDGVYRWFLIRAVPQHDADGNTVRWHGANTDIEDRKQAEEALGRVRSELNHVARVASLGALTASIAHEVNQPLAGIITNASTCLRMLAADPPNVDGARETARRTIRDGNRASEVIQRLRALFARRPFSAERVDLNEAAKEVMAMLLGELQRQQVVVHAVYSPRPAWVTGDRVQLQQVIVNLVLNAADAMQAVEGRRRQLRIATRHDPSGTVQIEVRDSGTGLGGEPPERFFQAFYTTKSAGMGIGLSVSRSIIESHGGQLWARDNADHGATFGFILPAGDASDHSPGAPALGDAS
jgi:PAS domain S-box-containing protein